MAFGGRQRARSLTVDPVRQQRRWHFGILGSRLATFWDGKIVSGFDGYGIDEPEVNSGKLQSFRVIGISAGGAIGRHSHRLDAFGDIDLCQALR